MRLVASITVLPSTPVRESSASTIERPGTAIRTTSASETLPPSRPSRVTRCPARSHRSASPPPTFPLPNTVILIALSPPPRRILGEPRRRVHANLAQDRGQVVGSPFLADPPVPEPVRIDRVRTLAGSPDSIRGWPGWLLGLVPLGGGGRGRRGRGRELFCLLSTVAGNELGVRSGRRGGHEVARAVSAPERPASAPPGDAGLGRPRASVA